MLSLVVDSEPITVKEIRTADLEIPVVKMVFGDKSSIIEKENGWKISGELKDDDITGGEKFIAEVEPRKLIPIDLGEEYGKMTGLEVKNLIVDSEDVLNDYQIFVGAQIEKNGTTTHIGDNMSHKDKRIIITETFKYGSDLTVLNHEKGHIEDKSFSSDEQRIMGQRYMDIISEYLSKDGEVDIGGLGRDKRIDDVLKYFVKTERKADKWAIDHSRNKEETINYLEKVIYNTYIETWGKGFENAIGQDRLNEIFEGSIPKMEDED